MLEKQVIIPYSKKKINKCERCKQASEKIKHLDELPVDWTVIYFSFLIC